MRIGKNTPWLVKTSSGRVIGPFFDKDLINRLRTREITLIDEISRPCGRWIYIRDEPTFASVAEEMRQKNGRGVSDDTTKNADFTLTPSHTVSITDVSDSSQADDRTEEISSINVTYTEPVREVIQRTTTNVTDETFVFEGDVVVRNESSSVARWMWALTAIVFFAAIGFVVFRQFVTKPIQVRQLAAQGVAEAEAAFAIGDYERALGLYKRAYDTNQSEQKIFLPYSLLSIAIESQTVVPRRLLENLLTNQERNREKIQTALALAYIGESKYADAESRLMRALDVDQMFRPAMIDLGALGVATQDYEKANNHLQLAVKDGSRDGIEFLLLTKTLVALYDKDKDKSYLIEANQFLDQYLLTAQDYRQEAIVASIYIDTLRGEKGKILEKISNFLEVDPEQTELHRHDLYIYRKGINWDELNQWCLKSTDGFDPLAKISAFEAVCLYKSGDLKEANRKISDAIQQSPRDSVVQAVYGYILSESNLEDKAKSAFIYALDFNREKTLQLPRLLMARSCEKSGDFNCAAIYWGELSEINSRSLPAIAGLAAAAFAKSDKGESRRFLDKGLRISPNYKPLLSLSAAMQ